MLEIQARLIKRFTPEVDKSIELSVDGRKRIVPYKEGKEYCEKQGIEIMEGDSQMKTIKTIEEIMPPVSEEQFGKGKQGSIEKHERGVKCTEENWLSWGKKEGFHPCALCKTFEGQGNSCFERMCPLKDRGVDCCDEYQAAKNAWMCNKFLAFHYAEKALLKRIKALEYEDYLRLYWASMKGERFEGEWCDEKGIWEIIDYRGMRQNENYLASNGGLRVANYIIKGLHPIVRLVEEKAGHKAGDRFRADLWMSSEKNVLWEHVGEGYLKEGEYFLNEDGDVIKTGYNHISLRPIVKLVEEKAHRFQVGNGAIWNGVVPHGIPEDPQEITVVETDENSRVYPYLIKCHDRRRHWVRANSLSPLPESKKAPVDYPPDMIGRDGTPMWFCQNSGEKERLAVVYYDFTGDDDENCVGWDILPSTFSLTMKTGNEPDRKNVMDWLRAGNYERMPKDKAVIDGVTFEAWSWYGKVGNLQIKTSECEYALSYPKSAGEIICRKLGIVPRKYCEKEGDC